jgi:glycosyltransferase involved in cell wall biosynthesis
VNKLIIQIPCYNEEQSLPVALRELPREVPGFDVVEWLIIDDGSTDDTVRVAREHGVDHILRLNVHRGLARAFTAGLDYCIKAGADVIVNTDADNQYNAQDIPVLVAPILAGEAEFVVGARPIDDIQHFSFMKKVLQRLGSWVVRMASSTNIPDAPSGFRAMTRDVAMGLNVFGSYTYTLETVIQAGRKNMAITSLPIRTNRDLRPSRLVKSPAHYVRMSIVTTVRIFMTYRPFRFFVLPGIFFFLLALIPSVRYAWLHFTGHGGGNLQSLIGAAILFSGSFVLIVAGFLAELIGVNRQLLEEIRWRLREREYQEHRARKGK